LKEKKIRKTKKIKNNKEDKEKKSFITGTSDSCESSMTVD